MNPVTIPASPAFPEDQEETPDVREAIPEEVDPQMQVNPEGKEGTPSTENLSANRRIVITAVR